MSPTSMARLWWGFIRPHPSSGGGTSRIGQVKYALVAAGGLIVEAAGGRPKPSTAGGGAKPFGRSGYAFSGGADFSLSHGRVLHPAFGGTFPIMTAGTSRARAARRAGRSARRDGRASMRSRDPARAQRSKRRTGAPTTGSPGGATLRCWIESWRRREPRRPGPARCAPGCSASLDLGGLDKSDQNPGNCCGFRRPGRRSPRPRRGICRRPAGRGGGLGPAPRTSELGASGPGGRPLWCDAGRDAGLDQSRRRNARAAILDAESNRRDQGLPAQRLTNGQPLRHNNHARQVPAGGDATVRPCRHARGIVREDDSVCLRRPLEYVLIASAAEVGVLHARDVELRQVPPEAPDDVTVQILVGDELDHRSAPWRLASSFVRSASDGKRFSASARRRSSSSRRRSR